MARRRPITIWSILALVVAVAGTISTLVVARAWLLQWVSSGQKFAISETHRLMIPPAAIQSLVYYESDHSVETQFMRLYMRDVFGERYYARTPPEDNQFAISGRQGRALFRLDLEEGGEYEFRCDNPNYASDDQIPVSDRVVFMKSPNTKHEVLEVRRVILATGGSVTILGTLILYIVHGLTLHRRANA